MFEGFKPRMNLDQFTAIPNELFDKVMKELNGSELKILLTLFRKTYGWVKEIDKNGQPIYKTEDYISISQFQEMTGLSNRSIVDNLEKLRKKGYVVKIENYNGYNKANKYAINQRGSEKSSQGGSEKSSQPLVKKVHTQKKYSKEIYKREEENVRPLIPKEIYDLYSNLYHKNLSVNQYNQLTSLTDNRELITYVIKTCKDKYNARTFEYIRRTLADWTSNGVQTVSEAKRLIGEVSEPYAINDRNRQKNFEEVEKFLERMGELSKSKNINKKFYRNFEEYRK